MIRDKKGMGLKKYKKNLIILSIAILIMLIFSCVIYLEFIGRALTEQVEELAISISSGQASTIEERINTKKEELESIANIYTLNKSQEDYLVNIDELKRMAIKRKFKRIGIADIHGNAITTDSKLINIADEKYFQDILGGEDYAYEKVTDSTDNNYIFVSAVPIKNDKEIIGVLFSSEEIYKLTPLQEGVGQYVIDINGDIIAIGNDCAISIEENYFDVLEACNDISDVEVIRKNILNGENGTKFMRYKGKDVFIGYVPLNSESTLFSVVAILEDDIEYTANIIFMASVILLVVLMSIVMIGIVIITIIAYKNECLLRENEMKKKFLANISHEIRTPISGIIGTTELALANTNDPIKVTYYLEKAIISSNNLLRLLNDLISISKNESGEIKINKSEVKINKIVEDINAIINPMILEKNQKYIVNIDTVKNMSIICDKNKVQQILLNLITNAKRYTPNSGEIKFSIELKEKISDNKGNFIFTVEDNGIGMTKEFMKKMFLPFVQADSSNSRNIGGAGLGLPITKSLVELMGGEIEVVSHVNKGSKFRVSLCLEFKEEELSHEEISYNNKKSYEIKPVFNGRRALIVEDNEINRIIETDVLHKLGFDVDSAENGKEALEKFTNSNDEYYDVILMDIQMPIMDGYEASKRIRESKHKNSKKVKIIAMTASTIIDDINLAHKSGMNECLSKPIEVNILTDVLSKYLKD